MRLIFSLVSVWVLAGFMLVTVLVFSGEQMEPVQNQPFTRVLPEQADEDSGGYQQVTRNM